MKTRLAVILSASLALCGCMTTNPNTGQKEYDPVKTEQVKAIFKPLVAGTVASIVKKNPDYKPIFAAIDTGVCTLANTNALSPATLRMVIAGALQEHAPDLDPAAVGGINAIIAAFEFWYASRLNADTEPNLYVKHISETLCDGILQGLMFYPDITKPEDE